MGILKNIGRALPGGVVGLATSAFNHRLAEKSAQQQYNRQLDFWQKQNEYNHPAQQRRRLEQAGLNPVAAINGIAGNNTAGQLSSVPGNDVAQRGAIDLGALNNSLSLLGQLESVGANTDLMKKQVELSAIEMLIKDAEKEGIEIDNATKEELKKWIPREKLASIFEALSRIKNNNESAKNTAEDTRAKQILNDEKQEARDEGINTFKDDHRAAEDAHQAALDAHAYAISSEERAKEIHSLNKQLLNGQITSQKYVNQMQADEADFSAAKRIMRSELGVDYYTLPVWLQADCLSFVNFERNLRNMSPGSPGTDDWFKYHNTLQEFTRLKLDFESSLKKYGYTVEYDSSYSNRKAEDTKSANAVNQSNYDREEEQREFENHMRKLETISNIGNALFN